MSELDHQKLYGTENSEVLQFSYFRFQNGYFSKNLLRKSK